jgi:lipoprotein-releasing system permease protein
VGWVVLVTFGFSLLATLYPAWRASRVQPAQALRYE